VLESNRIIKSHLLLVLNKVEITFPDRSPSARAGVVFGAVKQLVEEEAMRCREDSLRDWEQKYSFGGLINALCLRRAKTVNPTTKLTIHGLSSKLIRHQSAHFLPLIMRLPCFQFQVAIT
jgi:hypothetical protein